MNQESAPGIRIREAGIDDVGAMARIQVDTKRAYYLPFYPADLLMQMSYEKTAAAWRHNLWEAPMRSGAFALLAETAAATPVGVLIGGPEAGQDPLYHGEIYGLYVLPAFHGQGVGRALVQAAAHRLLEQGMTSLIIWVLAANPSRAFYEALGGKLARSRDLELGGYRLPEMGYGWADLRVLVGESSRIL